MRKIAKGGGTGRAACAGSASGAREAFSAEASRRIGSVPYAVLRPLLVLLSFPYAGLLRLRNRLYDAGVLASGAVEAPVLSVGNLTSGGTGKTPWVAEIVRKARERGFHPAVVARGYKGRPHGGTFLNDEGLLLLRRFPDLALIQDPDRLRSARRLVRERGADLIIMDDGFQHRRLRRDLDLVTVDATLPFDTGRVLPAGLLREPLEGLRRAHLFLLTRCDRVPRAEADRIESVLRRRNGRAPIFRTYFEATALRRLSGGAGEESGVLNGEPVFLCSGIAGPMAFAATVESLGAQVVGARVFPDHHDYSAPDVRGVIDEARAHGAARILVTEKDAVKLREIPEAESFEELLIAPRFLEGEEDFWALLFGALRKRGHR